MKFSFYTEDPLNAAADLLGFGIFEGQLSELKSFSQLDLALDGLLTSLVAEEDFQGKEDQSLLLHTHGRVKPTRLLLLGLGKREDFDLPNLRQYAARLVDAANDRGCKVLAAMLPPLDRSAWERAAEYFTEGAILGTYRFDRYQAEDRRRKLKVESVRLVLGAAPEDAEKGPSPVCLARAEVVAQAVCSARDLVNEPPGVMTPRALGEFARELALKQGLECKILGPKECEKHGMRLLLAVSQGSVEEPRFIHLTYRPKGKDKPKRRIALVGKGVTFDSGGLSLKPSPGMLDMKTDMAGAAAVLATLGALPSLGLKSEVHGIVAATENMISGSAYKLGDVVTGMGGKSVEIVNTDAEGRLTLADALAYAVKLSPDEIIDLATLTGACMVALGPYSAGVMGNDTAMVERFLGSARRVGEEAWQLPLPSRLKEQLKSPIADLKNAGERWGGALTAGLFLKEFVGTLPWVHVDIAGPSNAEKAWGHVRQGGTGYGVSTLIDYLQSRDGS
ncbi:MAG: leucyl aminopeptidase [Deltaproteobacteria bacterium]|nr:leucyl aminopeptidase [Deltaproteobacteria bacterium]